MRRTASAARSSTTPSGEPLRRPRFPWWLALSVLVTAAVIAGMGTWWGLSEYARARDNIEDGLLAIGQIKAGQISGWLDERLGDAALITETPALSGMIEQWLASRSAADESQIQAWFQSLEANYGYAETKLVDPAGRLLLGPASDGETLMPAALSGLQTALASRTPVLTDLHFGTDGETVHLDALAPLFGPADAGGEPLGAVVLTANAGGFLFPLIQTWPTANSTAETLLVERRGENVLFLNELRHQKGTALTLEIPLDQRDLPEAMAVQGTQGIVEGHDYRGVEVLAAVQAVPGSSWFIVSKIDRDEAFSGARTGTLLAGIVSAFLLLTLAGLMVVIWLLVLRKRYRQAYEAEASRRMLLTRYEHLVQQANDAIVLSDDEQRVVEVNERAMEMYGYSRDEFAGLEISRLIHPGEMPAFEQAIRQVESRGSLVTETLHQRRDGSVFPAEVSVRTVASEGRAYLQAIIRDLTERKRAETLLHLTQYSVNNAIDSVFWTDEEARFVFVSDSTCRRLGYSREELLTLTIADIVEGYSAEVWRENWRILQAGDPLHVEVTHRTKDGELFPAEARASYVVFDGRAYCCSFARDITDRKRAEEALAASETSFRRLFEAAAEGILILDGDSGVVTNANPVFQQQIGLPPERLIGRSAWEIEPLRGVFANRSAFDELRAARQARRQDLLLEPDSGPTLYVDLVSNVYEVDHRTVVECNFHDVTQRRAMEKELKERDEQLRQAQKMEAIGQLAGGIAHDFNNLLTAILGYCDLLLSREGIAQSSARAEVEQIRLAGERAAGLTRQILAFSRRQTLRPRVVSLNEVLESMETLLRRTLGEDIDLVSLPGPALDLVEVDVHQFEQVLMNLALNARDAMAPGGRLTIETANVDLDEEYCLGHPEASPGRHVMLAVSDTGKGMNETTRLRVFEPFFTTKAPGEGTGLGLATVYGTVTQSNGSITVYSEPGRGSCFKIYLPATAAVAAPEAPPPSAPTSTVGHETVLVVEDEPALLELAVKVLSERGYRVLAAGMAAKALEIMRETGVAPDLLVTDLVLPGGKQGKELAQELLRSYPDMAVLYMSGYTRNAIVHAGRLDEGIHFLEKPFTLSSLVNTVREVLDQAGRSPSRPPSA